MKKGMIIGIVIAAAALLVFLLIGYLDKREEYNPYENQSDSDIQKNGQESALSWKEKGIAIPGKYADAEVVDFDNIYRMYYTPEPEVSGFKGQVYSATSSDGINWDTEEGTRKEWATFPSVIRTGNGYRMYFQNSGVIKSAFSADGLNWEDEAGTRINKENNEGLLLDNVAAPTVMKIGDEYVAVYRGTINEKYSSEVPNENINLFLWATSKDGLDFEKKGIALDSRNSEFEGLLDGAEFVKWEEEIRLYFWSYKGVYHAVYESEKFSQEKFDFITSDISNPPGDPALARINGKWLMYYGQHNRGIYYAAFE